MRERVRQHALAARDPATVLPPALEARPPQPVADASPLPEPAGPAPASGRRRGERGVARRACPPRRPLGPRWRGFLERFLGPRLEAQVAFNAKQVQLDNEILGYVDARFAATHRHYDAGARPRAAATSARSTSAT